MDLHAGDLDFLEIAFCEETDTGTRRRGEFTTADELAALMRLSGYGYISDDSDNSDGSGEDVIAITQAGLDRLNSNPDDTDDQADDDQNEDGGDDSVPAAYRWWAHAIGEDSGDTYCCVYAAVFDLRQFDANDPFQPGECTLVDLAADTSHDLAAWLADHAHTAGECVCTGTSLTVEPAATAAVHSPLSLADELIPTMTAEDLEGLEHLDPDGLRAEVAMWVHTTVTSHLGLPGEKDLAAPFPNSQTWTQDDLDTIKRMSMEV